jgi:integrase
MATIRQRQNQDGTLTYHAQVRLKGYPAQTASFKRLTDARRWVARTESDIRDGRHFPGTAAKRHTVADMIDRYSKSILPHKAKSSIVNQTHQFAWWNSRVGHLRLSDLTPAVIAECRDELAQTFKPGTARTYIAAISHALTMAVREWRWLDANPVSNVTRPRDTQVRVRFLSEDERLRLLEACKQSKSPYLYLAVVLALSAGARKMEILTLRWPDVDLQRGLIMLHKTKNRERRALPLTGYALELMRQHGKVRRIDSDLVFAAGQDGQKPADIGLAWENARSRAGITDFRFHDLRHTAASYLAMNGASLAEIAEILGHKSFDMVKRYAHLSEQHTHGVVARMNQAIFGE